MAIILYRSIVLISLLLPIGWTSYVQKCCPRKKQLNDNFEQCIDYEGLRRFEKYDANVTWWREAGVNIVKMGDEDQHIWWMPPGTPIYSPPLSASKSSPENGKSSSTVERSRGVVTGSNFDDPYKPTIIYKENVTDLTFAYGDGYPACKPSDREIVPFNDDVYVLSNGALLLTGFKDNVRPNALMLPSSDYCLDRVTLIDPAADSNNTANAFVRDHTFAIITCPCVRTPCIRMCCPPRHYLKDGKPSLTCRYQTGVPKEWNLTYANHDDDDHVFTRPGSHFSVIHGVQDCRNGYYFLNKNTSNRYKNFKILPNGNVRTDNSVAYIPSGSYCVHYANLNGTYRTNLLICQRSSEASRKLTFRDVLYGSYFIVGSSFLAVTLLIYGLVAELRSSLHSKILMAHTASLLTAYITLAVLQLQSHRLPKYICIASAYIVQFSFIAAFFWLNVMCIDIAWTFSGYKISNSYITRDRNRKFMTLYSLYVWSLSSIISFLTALAEYGDLFPPQYKPKFGSRNCWFNDSLTTAVYFYLPIGVILFVNIFLFSYTTGRIRKMQNDSTEVCRGDSVKHVGARTTKEKNRLVLYAKLFGLMGVTWIFEILSCVVGGPAYYWYVTDAVNSLRGVFVFLIFCWKRRVLFHVCNRLPNSIGKKILACLRTSPEVSSSIEMSNNSNKLISTSTQKTYHCVTLNHHGGDTPLRVTSRTEDDA